MNSHRGRRAISLLLCLFAFAVDALSYECPKDYSGFVRVTSAAQLQNALSQGTQNIYLAPGRYQVNNPIVIDRSTPLVLIGFAPNRSHIAGTNAGKPIFEIVNCPYLHISRVSMDMGAARDPEMVMMHFKNSSEMRFDGSLIQCEYTKCIIEGPGTFVFQNCTFHMHNRATSTVMVNHEQAKAYFYMGTYTNDPSAKHYTCPACEPDVYHVWVKKGHFEGYSMLIVSSRGRGADFRFDSPSPRGAHVLANVRSEGIRGEGFYPGGTAAARADGLDSHLAYVPQSDQEIDLVVKGCILATRTEGADQTDRFIEYHAAGTVWLLGNLAWESDLLLRGNNPKTKVVAVNNFIHCHDANNPHLFNSEFAGKKACAGNTFADENRSTNSKYVSFIDADADMSGFEDVAPMPRGDPNLPVVESPSVGSSLPPCLAGDLKSVVDLGAIPDDGKDDTDALQTAFDTRGYGLYFPPGTYNVSRAITFQYWNDTFLGRGGWIAGAGAQQSKIMNAGTGGVLSVGDMFGYQVEALTFECADKNSFNVDVFWDWDNAQGSSSAGSPTTFVLYYKCVFAGGNHGLSIGMNPDRSTIMTDDQVMLRCTFRDAVNGWGNGHWNAVRNTALYCDFVNNDYAYNGRQAPGTIINSTFRGNQYDFHVLSDKIHNYVFINIDSDSKRIHDGITSNGQSGGVCMTVMDGYANASLDDAAAVWTAKNAGGVVFVNSKVNAGYVSLIPAWGTAHDISATKLWSEFPQWNMSAGHVSAHCRLYEYGEYSEPTGTIPLIPVSAMAPYESEPEFRVYDVLGRRLLVTRHRAPGLMRSRTAAHGVYLYVRTDDVMKWMRVGDR